MAYPDDLLPLRVDLSLDGSTWTDISSDVRYEDKVRITRGRSDWGQQTDPGRCSFSLSNTDGKYSPQNPRSPYFGQIGRNTPVRVSVNTGSVALSLPGGAGDVASTPDTAALDITDDIDIRVDATLANWCLPDYPSTGETTYPQTNLIGKDDDGQRSWVLSTRRSRPYLEYSTNGSFITNAVQATADLPLTTSGRIAVRATLDVDTGAGAHVTTFYTAPTMAGPWTQLGDQIVSSGTVSIYAGSAPLRIGDAKWLDNNRAIGLVHAVELRSGIGGTVVANPDFTAQASGATGFADSAGRTWTIGGQAEITNRKTRFVGEIASWTPRWDTGGKDVVTQVEAAGVLRRLGVGSIPTKSAMYREFTSPGRVETGIHGYWPMEDGADATKIGSAVSGHPPMTYTAGVTLAAYDGWVASGPVPTVTSGRMRVMVPSYLRSGNTSQLGLFCRIPEAGTISEQRIVSWSTTATAEIWSIVVNTSGAVAVRVWDEDGVKVHDSGFSATAINGRDVYLVMLVTQNLGDSFYDLLIVDIARSLPTSVPDNVSSYSEITNTVVGYQPGIITQVRMGEDAGMNGTALGHLVIGRSTTAFNASAGTLVGWNGEEGPSRVSRIGTEENVHSYATGPGDEQCGTQPSGTALDVMRAAGEVDEGILAEQRSILGIRYVTRASMYNQPAALVLDYTGDDGLVTPLEPVDDDQAVTNDVTVARTSGSSARVTQETGPLSTLPPPAGIGLYDTAATLDLLDDDQPVEHAGWRLHLGTWDETRFPRVTVNLAGAPHMIEDAAAVDTGSRIQVTNPPVWLPPDTIDLLVQGYSETLDQFVWEITYNCTPYGPWNVAYEASATGARYGRADTDGTEVAAAVDATATTLPVKVTDGPAWVTAGIVLNANPDYAEDLVGWTGFGATIERVAAPDPRPFAGEWALKLTPDGVEQYPNAGSSQIPVTPGRQYTLSGWLRCATPRSVALNVNWFDNAAGYLSTSSNDQPVTAETWTWFETVATAPVGAAAANVAPTVADFPPSTDVLWAHQLTLRPVVDDGLPGEFPFDARVGGEVVRVTACTPTLLDTFDRTVSGGWGAASSGLVWSTSGGSASDYSVSGGVGRHSMSTKAVARITSISGLSLADVDMQATMSLPVFPTGNGVYTFLLARADIAADRYYLLRMYFGQDGLVDLSLRKRSPEIELAAVDSVAAFTAGSRVRARLQVQGTTVRAKAWAATGAEPAAWQVTATDTEITSPGTVGVRSYVATSNTNPVPVVVEFDDVTIDQQLFTVQRSLNGVTKAHTPGTDVRLAYPAYTAL
ncbi:hypothetical protein ACFW5V_28535 [Streptomyces sp. NPDC058762]|uniref:hypothetical protein n=1 Tax=Streptomyces sp. NPDC058762 TaxID=3346629 RepID=UPI0036AD6D79